MTPGEAKKGYYFIKRFDLANESYNELNIYLYNLYLNNKESINYDKLLFLFSGDYNLEDLPKIDIENYVMKNFVEYSIQENSNKELYLKHFSNILTYICKEHSIVEKIIRLYESYDDKLKLIEKDKKESYIVEKLDDLIGLDNVKKQINHLADWAYITKLRKEKGLKTNSITMHMVFTGSPGTGKTTVARIIADIYHKLGIIEQDKLIEVSREDLVAEYLGQSEIKTKKVLDDSKGGVLFIDEAYSLTENNDEYGNAVVNTILKFMEDNRDNTVIIIAGYPNEIEQFIKSNPGLRSRFNTYLKFDNYNSGELLEILKKMISSNDYTILEKDLELIFNELNKIDTTDIFFSNARYIRNLFENAIKHQATRLARENKIDAEALQLLTFDDFYK